ncbi:MAG: glutamate synthase, partial [Candidatus Altarchaeaceae archaeon]
MGVSKEILENDYLLNIAIIDPNVQEEIEKDFIEKYFEIHKTRKLETIDNYKDIGLEVKPPDVVQYFVRVKKDVLEKFKNENKNFSSNERDIEDEFVYRNSFKINKKYYASLGEKKAFVLSHGRNMMILKIVGYAEQIIQYYKIENLKAHIWIAHQRYPTRGRIWHPGGCHPFNAMNEALVHNGDFANYHSIYEYLIQRNYQPLFLTDTEEATLLLDLWNRIYKYPLEYLIEAFAPTSEMDFDKLPEEKQKIYRIIQQHHVHCSPDGPWFFIIARNNVEERSFQLIGITDTSMLRPQVFAIKDGEVQVGLIASEKQAIDATLYSISEELKKEGKYFVPVADKYWNARGGSYTDGGAFIYTLPYDNINNRKLICTDKFGNLVETEKKEEPNFEILRNLDKNIEDKIKRDIEKIFSSELKNKDKELFNYVKNNIVKFGYAELKFCIEEIKNFALKNDNYKEIAINSLTLLNDLRYDTGKIKRSWIIFTLSENLKEIFSNTKKIYENKNSKYVYIDFEIKEKIRKPENNEEILIINGEKFQPEGDDNSGLFIAKAYNLGWKKFIIYNNVGQRFIGCGLGPATKGVRIDVYGSSGDYLGSGIDGMEIYVHGDAQDQLGQIMKSGKLVVYGNVGQ